MQIFFHHANSRRASPNKQKTKMQRTVKTLIATALALSYTNALQLNRRKIDMDNLNEDQLECIGESTDKKVIRKCIWQFRDDDNDRNGGRKWFSQMKELIEILRSIDEDTLEGTVADAIAEQLADSDLFDGDMIDSIGLHRDEVDTQKVKILLLKIFKKAVKAEDSGMNLK